MVNEHLIHLGWGEPFQARYFGRVWLKRARVGGPIEPDEFLVGLVAGGKVFDPAKTLAGCGGDADLFWNLALHGGVILFAGIDMSTDTGGPATGFTVFQKRAFL